MQESSSVQSEPRALLERVDAGRLTWGLVLFALGMLFALDRFTTLDLFSFYRLFPLILTVIALACLVTAKRPGQIRSGLWLLGVSSWLLINFFNLAGFNWGNSWPLMIMIAGVVDLLQPKPGESRLDGLWPLGIGFWLLCNALHLGGLNWGNSWPIILIFVGIGMVLRSLKERQPEAPGEAKRVEEGPTQEARSSHGS